MPAKLSFEQIVERSNMKHSSKYTYRQDSNNPAGFFGYCKEHDIEFFTDYRKHVIVGTPSCPNCVNDKRNRGSKRLSNEEFILRATEAHNGFFTYEKTEYRNGSKKITITCPLHGVFTQNAKNHMNGFNGCARCNGIANTKSLFIEKAVEVHGTKYSYDEVEYIKTEMKVNIICPHHGIFKQSPNKHMQGRGCPRCKATDLGNRQRLTQEQFLEKALTVHESRYDYSKAKYKESNKNITIICRIHGEFKQTPASHFNGSNCPTCASITMSESISLARRSDFLEEAIKTHGNRYDYSKTSYERSYRKVTITCKKHGDFLQTPASHLRGQGCPSCHKYQSKGELQWLKSLGIDKKYHQKWVMGDRNQLVDAYVPETNTVYEYYGNYWHGNPKIFQPDQYNKQAKMTFGQLYERTLLRERGLIDAGFNLVTIWEDDWKYIERSE